MVAKVSRPTYTAICRRVGDWWAIDVRELRGLHTQARRLDQAEAMTRDAIALLRDVPADSFDVIVEPHLDEAADGAVASALAAIRRARQANEEASRLQLKAIKTLLTTFRLTVRDTGALLHVSPQRVSQLSRKRTPTHAPPQQAVRSAGRQHARSD